MATKEFNRTMELILIWKNFLTSFFHFSLLTDVKSYRIGFPSIFMTPIRGDGSKSNKKSVENGFDAIVVQLKLPINFKTSSYDVGCH